MPHGKNPSSLIARNMGQEERALDDGALVAAIARRQEDAFERLYDRYRTMVYHLALKVLNSRENAEEVVYDVFWQVWREAPRYDARRGSVGAWLATLARSRAIDALRARRNDPIPEEDLATRPIGIDPAESPEETVSIGQRDEIVRAALNNLPSEQRLALEMAFFRGLTHAEIAAQLQEPLGTIKTRIRSAMLRLQERLRPLLGRTS
jgi:RNA polymerase sigma-70 factor, ECF subfamily